VIVEQALRRCRVLEVTPELVAHMGIGSYRVVKNNLPSDAEVVGGYWDGSRRMFGVVVSHPSFDEVPRGDKLPIQPSPMIEYDKPPP
jgi:hypothetical protein